MNLDEKGFFFIPQTPLPPIHVKRFSSALTISTCFFIDNLEMPGYHSYSWNVFWNKIPVFSQKYLSSTNLNQILKIKKKKKVHLYPSIPEKIFIAFIFYIEKKNVNVLLWYKIPRYQKGAWMSSIAQSIFSAFSLPIFPSTSAFLLFSFFFFLILFFDTYLWLLHRKEDFKECFSEELRSCSPENKHLI